MNYTLLHVEIAKSGALELPKIVACIPFGRALLAKRLQRKSPPFMRFTSCGHPFGPGQQAGSRDLALEDCLDLQFRSVTFVDRFVNFMCQMSRGRGRGWPGPTIILR